MIYTTKEIFLKDFTDTPGGRLIKNGPYSGELFKKQVLIPAALEHDILVINMDGVFGYPIGFLEAAFGGLIRYLDNSKRITILIKSTEDTDIANIVNNIIREANHNLKWKENPNEL